MSKQRPTIVSLLDRRTKQGLPTELELTYTIAEEIDHLHERMDRQADIILGLIAALKAAIPNIELTES